MYKSDFAVERAESVESCGYSETLGTDGREGHEDDTVN